MLKGFNTLIKFSISEVVDKTSVGEHSVKHVIFFPTKPQFFVATYATIAEILLQKE